MPRPKLTDDLARKIHALYAEGIPVADIAARFGVSRSLVYRVAAGRCWRHLGLPPVRRSTHVTICGEANGRSKLTADQVKEIRALHDQGVSVAELARRFGISTAAIHHLLRGITWAWLP